MLYVNGLICYGNAKFVLIMDQAMEQHRPKFIALSPLSVCQKTRTRVYDEPT